MGEQRQRTAVICRVILAERLPGRAPAGGLATRVRMLAIAVLACSAALTGTAAAAAASRPHVHAGSHRRSRASKLPARQHRKRPHRWRRTAAQHRSARDLRRSGPVPRAEGDRRAPGKGTALKYAYTWKSCNGEGECSEQAGPADSYVLGSADVGNTLAVTVTASDADGESARDIEPLGDRPRGRRRRRNRLGRRLVRESWHDLQDAR